MSFTPFTTQSRKTAFAVLCLAAAMSVAAQTQKQTTPTATAAAHVTPSLSGITMDKKPFQIESLKGKQADAGCGKLQRDS